MNENDLDKALQAWHGGSGPLSESTNGLWQEPAPSPDSGGPTLPFITYTVIGSLPDDSMSNRADRTVVMFFIRSGDVSPLEVGRLAELFTARWDHALIPMIGHTVVRCDRSGGGGRDKDADGGWVVPITYTLLIQEGA